MHGNVSKWGKSHHVRKQCCWKKPSPSGKKINCNTKEVAKVVIHKTRLARLQTAVFVYNSTWRADIFLEGAGDKSDYCPNIM